MANKGYGDTDSRWDQSGPLGLQRRSEVKDPTGEPMGQHGYAFQVDSVGAEFKRKGWNKYEVPTRNEGDGLEGAKGVQMPGGNAGSNGKYNPADYPGGTTA